MQRIFVWVAALLALSLPALAQPTAVRSLGFLTNPITIEPHPASGGFLIVGQIETPTVYPSVVLQVDANGQTVSSNRIDVNYDLYIENMKLLRNGRYAIVGTGSDPNEYYGYLQFLDSSGVPSQATITDRDGYCEWLNVAPTADGGCIVIGDAEDNFALNVGMIARFDAQMDTTWTRVLSMPNLPMALTSAVELPNGDIFAGGLQTDITFTNLDFVLLKFTAAGDLVWSKKYIITGPLSTFPRNMFVDSLGHLYLGGLLEDPNTFKTTFGVFSLDTAGTFLWGKSLAGISSAESYGMGQGPGGELLISGSTADINFDDIGIHAAFSPSGNLLWSSLFDFGGGFLELGDMAAYPGGYLWTGTDNNAALLIQTDAQGGLASNCGAQPSPYSASPLSMTVTPLSMTVRAGLEISTISSSHSPATLTNQLQCMSTAIDPGRAPLSARVTPQPMHTSARILLPEGTWDEAMQLLIHDMGGRAISLPATRLADGFEIERGGLPAGLYGYQVLQGGTRIASGKLWIAD